MGAPFGRLLFLSLSLPLGAGHFVSIRVASDKSERESRLSAAGDQVCARDLIWRARNIFAKRVGNVFAPCYSLYMTQATFAPITTICVSIVNSDFLLSSAAELQVWRRVVQLATSVATLTPNRLTGGNQTALIPPSASCARIILISLLLAQGALEAPPLQAPAPRSGAGIHYRNCRAQSPFIHLIIINVLIYLM